MVTKMGKKKITIITIVVFVVGLIIAGGSYAFWSWSGNVNKNVIFNVASNLKNYIVYNEGESAFTGELNVSNSYQTNSIHSTISIYKTTNANLLATIHMDVNQIGSNMKQSTALKWVVTDGNSSNPGTVLAKGNFIGTNNGDTLTLVPDINITTTETFYTIWIWLDASQNPSSNLSGETLDTNVWTEVNQVDGAEDRYEVTRSDANYQQISATVVDSKYKVTHYAVTTTNDEPNSWATITPATDQAKVYNLNTTVNNTGTYYIWFKDENGRITHTEVEVSVIDTTAPSCNWGAFTPVKIANGETSSVTLTCTDTQSGVQVHNLTTSDFTPANNKITVTNVTKESVTNGYKYTITVTGTNNDGTTHISIDANKVKDGVGLGNASTSSGDVIIENIIGVSDAVVTLEYNSTTYDGSAKTPSVTVVKNGVTLTLNIDYTVAYSNNTNVGTATVTITGIGNYGGETTRNFTISYNSFNITLDNANATTNGTSTLYMRYADGVYLDSSYTNKMTTSANPITIPVRTGYDFVGYYDGDTQLIDNTGKITSTFTNIKYSSAKTLNAHWNDSEAPVASIVSAGNTLKSGTQTLSLQCTDNVGVTKYYFGTSSSPADSAFTTVTSTTTWTKTDQTVSAAGTYYLICKDAAGNTSNKPTKIYYKYTVTNMLQNVTSSNVGTYTSYDTNNYVQASTGDYIALKDTSMPLASIYTVPSYSRAARFKGFSTGAPSTTSATISSDAPTLSANNTVYTMWFQKNVIIFRYKPNGGTVTSETTNSGTTYTWDLDDNGYIRRTNTSTGAQQNYLNSVYYGYSSFDLVNYNYSSYLNISKTGYSAVSGAEWICESGCLTSNMTFTHNATTIDPATICNAETADCNLVLKVNWTPDTYNVFYNGTGGFYGTSQTQYDAFYNNINSHSTSATTFRGFYEYAKLYATPSNTTWGADYIKFNGTNSYVMTTQKWGAWTAATVSALIMVDGYPASGNYGYIAGNVETGGFGIYIDSTGKPAFQIYNSSTSAWVYATGPNALTIGKKYHIAGTYDGSNLKLYINGTLVKTTASTGSIGAPASSTAFALGCNPYASTCPRDYFNGKIYNVGVLSSARVATDIAKDWGKVITYDSTYGTLTTPTRSGYTFAGWYNSTALSTQVTSSTSVNTTGDRDLYAKWTPISYNIGYTLNSGSHGSSHPTTATFGSVVNISNPTRSGYTFTGWTSDSINTTHALRSDNNTTFTTGWNGTTAVTNQYFKNLTATADATVTLVANWSDSAAPEATIVSAGNTLKSGTQTLSLKCTDNVGVTKWYFGTSSSPADSAFTTVTSTTTWTKTDQTVSAAGTYYLICKDAIGNTSNKPSQVYYSYKVNNMLETASGSNSTFNTANYSQTSTATYIAKSGTSLTLSSIYTRPDYGVFYKISTGAAPSSGSATVSTTAPTLSANSEYTMWFYRSSMYFRYKPNGGTVATTTTSGSNTYTWSLHSDGYLMRSTNGATATTFQTKIKYINTTTSYTFDLANYNANSTSPNITRTGYSTVAGSEYKCLSGCITSNLVITQNSTTLTKNYINTNICTDATLKAGNCVVYLGVNWTNQFVITYNANGGSGAPANQTYTYAASGNITLSTTTPTKTGYTFLGWSTSSTATTASYTAGGSWAKSNVPNSGNVFTLYAVYRIKVTFNPGSGSVSPTSKYVDYNAAYGSVPTPTLSGKTFMGWEMLQQQWTFTNSTLTQAATSAGITCSSSTGYCTDSSNTTDDREWGYSESNWQFSLPAGKYRLAVTFHTPITLGTQYAGINMYDSSNNYILRVRDSIVNISYYETMFSLSSTKSISLMIKAYDAHYTPVIYKITDVEEQKWTFTDSTLRQPAKDVGITCSASSGYCTDTSSDSDDRYWNYSNSDWQFSLPAGKYKLALIFYEPVTTDIQYAGINIFDPSDNVILSVRNAIDRRTYYETAFSLSATTNISLMIKAYNAHYKPVIYKLSDINSPTLVTTNANHTLTAHWK